MADHVSDFTQSDDKIVLDLINHDNETNLTLEQVALSAPLGNSSVQAVSLTVAPVMGSGYVDSVDVSYSRLNIQSFMDIFFPDGMVLQQGDAITVAELLPEINTALAVAIHVDHIIDGPIGAWEGTPNEVKEVILAIATSCRTYFGNATVTLDGQDIPMEEAIAVKVLSGLNLPEGGEQPEPEGPVGFTTYRQTEAASQSDLTIGFEASTNDWSAMIDPQPGQFVALVNGQEIPWDLETATITIPAGTRTFGLSNRSGGLPTTWIDGGELDIEAITGFQADGQPIIGFLKSENFVEVPAVLPASAIDLTNLFLNAHNFNQDISGWDVSNVKYMSAMFLRARSFNHDLNSWNVSNVVDMSSMFQSAEAFNGAIGNWRPSKVTLFVGMFQEAFAFNKPIGQWTVGAGTDFSAMFQGAAAFNQDLSGWDMISATTLASMFRGAASFNSPVWIGNTFSVTDMSSVFHNASSFNQEMGSWPTGEVLTMRSMFEGATAFNQDLSSFDVRKVTDMAYMFNEASTFNRNLSSWQPSSCVTMEQMFSQATAFNGTVAGWATGNVTNMYAMFSHCPAFNGYMAGWDVSKVEDFSNMFYQCLEFNQDITDWQTDSAKYMGQMFEQAASFNQDLSEWNVSGVTNYANFDLGANSWTRDRPSFG